MSYINGELLVVNKQGYFDNVTQLKNCFSLQEMDLGRGLERLMKLAVSFKPYISSYIVRNWFLHLIHFSDVKKIPTGRSREFDLQSNSSKIIIRKYVSILFILIWYHLFLFCRSQIIWFGFYAFMHFFIVDLMLLLNF